MIDVIPLDLLRDIVIPEIPKIVDEREQECLAKNIYFEAAYEPYEGKVAVAQVTKNRVESELFPNSYCDVVWQVTKRRDNGKRVPQFSWTLDGKPDNPRNMTAYEEALEIAQEVLRGDIQSDIIHSSVYNYHAVYVKPKWSKYMRKVARVGNHIFYQYK
jgi:spore germination cell wall hydrolase CwlJ-like protein